MTLSLKDWLIYLFYPPKPVLVSLEGEETSLYLRSCFALRLFGGIANMLATSSSFGVIEVLIACHSVQVAIFKRNSDWILFHMPHPS